MTQTIVIFGGSGFIGRKVCQKALKHSYHVISISRGGQPKTHKEWMDHPNMTWKSYDVLEDTSWQKDLLDVDYCLNLIGIFFESASQTYDDMIVNTNHLISQWAKEKQIPYLFLSAKLGPIGYIKAKKQAEQEALTRGSDITIIRSGLVVDDNWGLKKRQGQIIQFGYQFPLFKCLLSQVYPVPVDKLANVIISCLKTAKGDSRLIDLTK